MSLQLRFGVAGAALGALLGLLGAIAAGVPFGILVLRLLVSALATGLLGLGLHFVVKTFLPELLESFAAESAAAPGAEAAEAAGGSTVDITLPAEGYAPQADQASELRRIYAGEPGQGQADEADGGDLIAEVSEERHAPRASEAAGGEGSFSEDAFYQGVERLPDIGGFSEQFQESDSDGTVVAEDGGAKAPSGSGGRSSDGNKGNMDPELIAKAIRTALKKDDQ